MDGKERDALHTRCDMRQVKCVMTLLLLFTFNPLASSVAAIVRMRSTDLEAPNEIMASSSLPNVVATHSYHTM